MQVLYFDTRETAKLDIIRRMVADAGLAYDVQPLPSMNGPSMIPATTARLEDVAEARVRALHGRLNQPVMVEENGYYIPALQNFPGPVTYFTLKTVGLTGILRMMRGEEDRRCIWRTAIAYMDEQGRLHKFKDEGVLGWLDDNTGNGSGTVGQQVDEENPNPFWAVFIPENYDHALATLSPVQLFEYYQRQGDKLALGRFVAHTLAGKTPEQSRELHGPE